MSCSLTSHATGSVDIVLALLLLDTAVVAGVDTEEAAAGNELDDAEDADAAWKTVFLNRGRLFQKKQCSFIRCLCFFGHENNIKKSL